MADLAKLAVTFTADTSPVRRAVGEASKDVRELANTAKDAAKATDRAFDGLRFPGMSKATERFERDWQRIEKQLGVSVGFRVANDNAERLGRNLDRMGIEAAGAAQRMTLLDRASGSIGTALAVAGRAVGALGVGLAVIGGGAAVASVVSTANEFQKLGASLKTVTGSAENAERAMAFIRQFATETPFTLQEVTQSFIRLQSLGLDPSRKALEAYGNVASAMGTPMMQFIEAVADAMTGEFERLKEYGIRASQDGDKVALTFQGVTTTIGKNAKEIETYLQNIGRVQFGGAMAEQMSILPGIFGNASDAIDTFKNAIGEGGLTSAIATVVSRFTEFLNANEGLATSIGSVVGGGIDLYSAAMQALGVAATEAYRWIMATGEVLGGTLAGFTAGREAVASFGSGLTGVASGLLSSAGAVATGWQASGEAIYATLNAIIGAGVGAYQAIEASWNQLPVAFAALAKSAGNALVSGLETAVNGALSGVNRIISGINSIAPDFAKLPELPAVDLSAFKASLTEAQSASAQTVTSIIAAAQSTDYLGAGLNAVAGPIGDVTARIADAKRRLDEAAAAGQDLGTAAKLTGEGFQIVGAGAAGTGQAIDGGITKPSKEAAKALREAEQAKRALFSEADAAVERFFPMQAAQAEATRLQSLIDDTGNGLTDLQRRALGMQIDQGFRDAMEPARGLRNSVRGIGDEFDRVGSIGEDAFTGVFDALTQGGDVIDNVLDALGDFTGPAGTLDKFIQKEPA